MKNIILNTIPADARSTGSINLGMEITKNKLNVSEAHWREQLDYVPEIIYANIFYITHIFNLISFLKRNNIEALKNKRRNTSIIVGGQGVSNLNGCLDEIVDEIYMGESDGDYIDKNGWVRVSEINSDLNIKGNKAVVELTRGCKYRCSFCEYGWVHGGKYREKDISLVKSQIQTIKLSGINNINFLSANLASYSGINELIEYCAKNNIKILNSDLCIRDFDKINNGTFSKSIKVGVESFDEITRKNMNKYISDDDLMEFFKEATKISSNIHCYLIYGLPNDNYAKWFEWVERLSYLRKGIEKPLRIEFNLTNFEPCKGTPLENAPMINFSDKNDFLQEWIENLIKFGFIKQKDGVGITYKNAKGRLGRKENSYLLLMKLRDSSSEITNAIIESLPNGVGRSIKDPQAIKFLSRCEN